MAIARLHGGPLDGQILPLNDTTQDELIVPYGTTQIVYERRGEPTNTGADDGPTEVEFGFVDAADGIGPNGD